MSGTAEGRMEIVRLSSIIIMNLRVGLKIIFERFARLIVRFLIMYFCHAILYIF